MNPDEFKNPFRNGKVVGDGVEPADYHRENTKRGQADFVMGRSSLMDFSRCPHRWLMGYTRKDSDSTDWGNIMDCKVLAPEKFLERFAVKPATYPAEDGTAKPWNGNSKWCKQWLADHTSQECIGAEKHTETNNAVKFLYGDPEAREFIKCSRKQVMVVAEYADEETGLIVPVKILIDLLPATGHPKFGKGIGDYKSTSDAHPFPWGRSVNTYGYAVQAAFYIDVYSAAVPQERDTFYHVIQESEPPWEVGKRILSQEFLEIGRMRYLEALQLYCQCLKANVWPPYEMAKPGRLIIDGWLVTSPENWMHND
jgi:hypothetical protein